MVRLELLVGLALGVRQPARLALLLPRLLQEAVVLLLLLAVVVMLAAATPVAVLPCMGSVAVTGILDARTALADLARLFRLLTTRSALKILVA